jgi:peptide/nickel transport system permease protein
VLRFLGLRVGYTLAVLVAVSMLVFAVTELLPGNVVTMILGTDATPEDIARLERLMGLSDPPVTRYLHWASGVARGDFGESLRMQRPIGPILADRLTNSLVLAGIAFLMVALGGLALGLVTALNEGSRLDRVVSAVAVVGTSLPEFVTATVLILLFAGGAFRLLPPSGYDGFAKDPVDALVHLVLPSLSLAVILTAYVGRVTRTSVIDALRSDYVRTARLKGLPPRTVVLRHVLPNALVPTITVLFMNLGWMFGGIVVVEEIFVFPGIGRLMLFGISERDWPVIQACAIVIASVYVIGNFVGDLLVLAINPRLREGAT